MGGQVTHANHKGLAVRGGTAVHVRGDAPADETPGCSAGLLGRDGREAPRGHPCWYQRASACTAGADERGRPLQSGADRGASCARRRARNVAARPVGACGAPGTGGARINGPQERRQGYAGVGGRLTELVVQVRGRAQHRGSAAEPQPGGQVAEQLRGHVLPVVSGGGRADAATGPAGSNVLGIGGGAGSASGSCVCGAEGANKRSVGSFVL